MEKVAGTKKKKKKKKEIKTKYITNSHGSNTFSSINAVEKKRKNEKYIFIYFRYFREEKETHAGKADSGGGKIESVCVVVCVTARGSRYVVIIQLADELLQSFDGSPDVCHRRSLLFSVL